MKTLLLLDVDGVLNINKVKPTRRPEGFETFKFALSHRPNKPYNLWMNPSIGETLISFCNENDLELAWCTTWENDANKFISPAVGLPQLPVVKFPMNMLTTQLWKFHGAERFAMGRSLIWFDDQFSLYEKARDVFMFNRSVLPTLLHQINPDFGITQQDLNTVKEWLVSQV